MSKIGNTGGEGFSGSCEGAEKRTGVASCANRRSKGGLWVAGEVAVSVVSSWFAVVSSMAESLLSSSLSSLSASASVSFTACSLSLLLSSSLSLFEGSGRVGEGFSVLLCAFSSARGRRLFSSGHSRLKCPGFLQWKHSFRASLFGQSRPRCVAFSQYGQQAIRP